MTNSTKSQHSESDMIKIHMHHNEGFVNQHRLIERKLTALELAKQYLSEMRNESFR